MCILNGGRTRMINEQSGAFAYTNKVERSGELKLQRGKATRGINYLSL